AVRRLHPDPVPRELLLELLELSLKAPPSSNSQDWAYVVVQDREQKAKLSKLYRPLYRTFNPMEMRAAKGDAQRLRQIKPGQWQGGGLSEMPRRVVRWSPRET